MGHGLAAALPLLSIVQTFRTMIELGYKLPVIIHEMNASLQRQIPRGFFVSATLAAIDRHNRTVEVWYGGNPAALWVKEQGEVMQRFESAHVPLGVLPSERFEAHTSVRQLGDYNTHLCIPTLWPRHAIRTATPLVRRVSWRP